MGPFERQVEGMFSKWFGKKDEPLTPIEGHTVHGRTWPEYQKMMNGSSPGMIQRLAAENGLPDDTPKDQVIIAAWNRAVQRNIRKGWDTPF